MSSSIGSTHQYGACVTWTGNTGAGTAAYDAYSRDHTISVTGKPPLNGSADPAYRGDAGRHNPEDLFIASIAACHMLFYLALSARASVRVTAYRDDASGHLVTLRDGSGRFDGVALRPRVTVAVAEMVEVAMSLHEVAHQRCFIAASCSIPITVDPTVNVATSQ